MARTDGDRDRRETGEDWAAVETSSDMANLVSLGATTPRQPLVHRALPNTNLMSARIWLPQLRAMIPAGETILACFACASPDRDAVREALATLPALPAPEALRERIRATGRVPCAMSGRVAEVAVPR